MRNGKIFTRFQKILKSISIFILFAIPMSGFAQYDYEHYVPPFYNGSSNNGDIGKHTAVLSTNSTKDVNVYIYKGDGTLLNASEPIVISRNTPYEYVFETPSGASKGKIYNYPYNYDFPLGVIGAVELNKVLTQEGIRLYSPDAPFFVNIRHISSVQGGSLTTKGTYAYGTEFRSGHLYTDAYHAQSRRSHFISVMAVEDCEVTFTDIKCGYLTKYNGTNAISLESIDSDYEIKVNLSKGESYVIGVDHEFTAFKNGGWSTWNGMNGTSITSTAKIAVTSGSWTSGPNDGQDMGFDQIVPIGEVRDQYVVMRGKGKDNTTERPIVVATVDGTEVWVNGVHQNPGAPLDAGDYYVVDNFFSGTTALHDNLFIDTKEKDVYVYQTMSGDKSTHGPTVGVNFIPPLAATGIKEVVVPYADYLAQEEVQDAIVTILAQKSAQILYEQTLGGTTTEYTVPKSSAVPVPGNDEWVSYTINNLEGNYRFKSNKAINVAWVVRDGYVGAAGYYSGFTKAISKIIPELDVDVDGTLDLICESYDDDIQVSIKEPTPDFYEWYVNDFVNDPIIVNDPLVVPAPDEETSYYVVGYYRDPELDILSNGDFADGTNLIESEYELVTGNLVEQGQFAIDNSPVKVNPILEDFPAMDDWDMFIAYSENQGDTIYKHYPTPVEEEFNYILKLNGRLAKPIDGVNYFDQSLQVLINNDTVIDNFKIDDVSTWQSASALWKPNGAKKATIKIVNKNLSGQDAIFALDSISFVQAVQDTAVFVARVIPNYSYSNSGKEFQFCESVQNSLDVSNGDTSWYNYSWSKKEAGTENYIDLTDGAEFSGTKTHELIFLDPQQESEGDYRCTISFKEEYQQCGSSADDVHVDLSVLVDEPATVSIDADKTDFCFGTTSTLSALVTGDAGEVKWYVNGGADPVSLENPFVFAADNPAGTYTVRCEVENGCSLSFDEVTLEVLAAPVLNDLTVNADLCEDDDIILTADASGSGTLTYYWKEGITDLAENGSVLTFPATMDHRSSIFSVSVSSIYTTTGGNVECPNDLTLSIDNLDIYPNVTITDPLDDVTLCEGSGNHTFEVVLNQPESYYSFSWEKDGVPQADAGAQKIIAPIELSDDAEYKVTVSNRCDTEVSTADLTVVAKMVVSSITADEAGPFCNPTNVTVTFADNGAVAQYKAKKPDGSEIVITNPYTFEVNTTTEGSWEFIAEPNCTGDPVSHAFTWQMIPDFGTATMNDIVTCIGKDVDFNVDIDNVPALSNLTYEWKDNNNNVIAGATTDVLSITNVQEANTGTYTCTVTDQCGRSKQVSADLDIQKVTTASTGAAIEKCVGDTDFRIDIAYLGTPTFEWRFNNPSGAVISNADFYAIASLTTADAGTYYCKVILECGDEISIQRDLIVNEHVSIINPADETIHICEGEQPVLEIEVNGNSDDYTIDWTNSSDVSLGLGDLNQVQLGVHNTPGTFTYKAKVTSFCDNLNKNYIVQVHEKPVLSTIDNDLQKCAGLVELNITESGEHNGITWWKNGVLITDGNADATNYVIDPAASPTHDGTYIAKVSSDYCGDNQVSISLDIRNQIVVTSKSAANTTVCENQTVSLFVAANGDDIIYKWYKTTDPTTILSNQPTLDLGTVALAAAGTYEVSLTNDLNCGNTVESFDLVVNKNPSVTNPISKVICETQASVDFTVVGDAQGTVNYQWYNNGGVIVGATAATYTENTPVDGEAYYCVVSGDACGTATSEKATLTVVQELDVINPLNQNIADGANATFKVVATGEPNYTYQWQENTGSGWNNIAEAGKYSGTKTADLLITNADIATFNNNQYRCVVNTDGGVCVPTKTSGAATLSINSVIKIASHPVGMDACDGSSVDLTIEGYFDALTYTWQYDDGSGYQSAVGDHSMTSNVVGKVSTLTIPSVNTGMNTWKFRCLVSDGSSTNEYSNEVAIRVLEDIAVSTLDANFTPCFNEPFAITVSATGDEIKYKWYKVGAESTILSTSATYNFGNVDLTDEGDYKCEIYNDLGCNDITRTFNVDVRELATVSDPLHVTMCSSDPNPTFTVTASGDGPFTYKWYNSTGEIAGATSNSFTETTPVDGEYYYCEVSTACNTVNSKSATLNVVEPLDVTNPGDLTIADGGTAIFSVTASGEPNYSYQWQEDSGSGFVNISDVGKYSGTTTETLVITGADQATFNGYKYQCIVSTDGGICISDKTSGEAILTIVPVDKILVQPTDDEVCFNDNASLSVEGNVGGLNYVWKYDDGSGGGFVTIVAQAGMSMSTVGNVSTLTIPATDLDINNWKFRCDVDAGFTPEESSIVEVRVLEDISITPGTINFTPCMNEVVNMSVSATGSDIKYKWYKDSDPATILSTNSSLNLANVSLAEEGDYTCEVYNDQACNNQIVNFNVDVKEFVTLNTINNVDVCESAAHPTFTITPSGDGPFSYQWYNSAGAIGTETSDSYTVGTLTDGESYYCEVTGACNTINSNAAVVTVLEEVAITTQPVDITIVDGDDAVFTVVASGEPIITYQWQVSTGGAFADMPGENAATLTIADAGLALSGNQYQCIVDNGCSNSVTSAAVSLSVNALIKIFTQPANLQACEADAVEFEITGTNTGYTYDWEYSTGGAYANAEVVAGMSEVLTANGSKLRIANVTTAMNTWTFRCIVKDGSSTDDVSNIVAVEVVKPVGFAPVDDQNLCSGESKQIELSGLNGTGNITYEWKKDGIALATTNTIHTIADTDNGNYEVTMSNGVCPDFTDTFEVSHYKELSIDPWDNASEVCVGNTETLTAIVDFDAGLTGSTTYKWYKDEVDTGVTTADYSLVATAKNQSGQYKLEVSDGCSTQSISGYVNVFEPVVAINTWDANDEICVGSELNLEVQTSGDVKSYTWTHDGNPLAATTNYIVAEVTLANAGTYRCEIEHHCGSVITYTIDISIIDAPSIDGTGIENLTAVCEGDPLVLGAISVSGSYDEIKWTLSDDSEDTTSGLTLDLGNATPAMEGNYKVAVSNVCGSSESVGTQVVNPKPTLEPIADQVVCEGEDVVFRAKATGRDLKYQWKIDGVDLGVSIPTLLRSGLDILPDDPFTPKTYTVECIVTDDNGCGGTLTETAQLTVNPGTILKATLKNVVKFVGEDYTMTVDVTGHNLTYSWTHVKDGVTTALPQTGPSINFTDIQMDDAGYYNCEITGSCGIRLASGKLTVKEPVVVEDGLASLEEKCIGEPLNLTINASGQISSVSWTKDGTPLANTELTLYIAELTSADAGVYRCIIEGEGAPAGGIIEEVTVRVYENTTLLAALGTQTVCEGDELSWIPNVSGASDIEYKWMFGGVEVSTDKILHYDAILLSQEGDYEVQVSGLCGDVSTSGSLEVIELPSITSVSASNEVCENTSLVEFNVEATGENLKYQWRKDGVDMAGKTSPVLSLTNIQLDDDAVYSCRVYNSCSEAIGTDITLTVTPQLRILSEIADIEVCSGEEVTLTADVDGNNVTYQWKLNGVDLAGETSSVLNLGVTTSADNGYYTCIVSDNCTDSRSTKPTLLTVHELPNTAIFGRMKLCAKEDRVTYLTNQIDDNEYGWSVDGGVLAGPNAGLRTRVTWGDDDTGQLSVFISDIETGCEAKVDSLVTLNALPTVNLNAFESKGVCEESFTLAGGYPEGGIYWVNDISEEVFDPAEKGPGTYNIHYTYTDENGCSNVTSKTTLNVDPLPTVNITDNVTIGSCKPFALNAQTDENNIQWSPATDLDDANSMTPTFTPGESQVLIATVMDEHGCTNMDLVEITVAPLPIVTSIADTTVGQCNQLQLLTDIVGDAGEITWTNPDHLDAPDTRSPKIINAPEGTYTYKISVTDLYGCEAEDEVVVNMVADPTLDEDQFGCEGDQFEVNIAGMDNPIWDDGFTDEARTIDQPGKYLLTVENEHGCGDEQNFVINPTPNLDLRNNLIYDGPDELELTEGRPVSIFEGQTVTIAPNLPLEYSPYFFEWQDGSILQRYEASETGIYKLIVQDNLGCTAIDSVEIDVKPVGLESPNAFTPNSNNENDRFYLKDINYDIEKFEMYVYNRWGELLYTTNEVGRNGGWDGKYNGNLCPAGAYVWMVFINGELTNKGTFMLIR
ncbi:T9SS type B sorting domain-containing protein [Marinifilum caeruleilacunae]|uniref:T9SS type B sorting domain-containing protein n=1 Tax=Marinifilum caeruleilacunae TaxID=2499076 RepID=A0ABX1WUU3_9BACT|nr:T9SS type B sorting domain-containing protein [Marinifilum caeruleilacunae]NOU59796.1 T9SS type B sorting domain-containing protein [Marinifilum caeruleilacunae]